MNRAEQSAAARRARPWLAGACLLFAAPRVAGLFTDFWLDEIWALDVVGRIAAPLDLFTRVHFDTNHWLYSLILFWIGPREDWIAYRIPALAAGVATLPLLASHAGREGTFSAGIGVVLAGASFLLIEYSSEARGYSLAVFFALASFHALGRHLESGRVAWALAFNASSILGLLSHLSFVFPYSGLLAWSLAQLLEKPILTLARARHLAECHALPVLAFLALYWVDIRHINHGAGPEDSVATVIGRLAALILGLPDSKLFQSVAVLLCAGIGVAGIWSLARRGARVWVFHAVTLFAAPLCVVAARSADFPYWTERHFLVCAPFLLLLLTGLLARLCESGRAGSAAALLVLALYLTGNSVRSFDFLRLGRGHYREAVEFVFAQSPERSVSVGSDNDFRNSMLLAYYERFVPAGRELVYVSQSAWPREGPQWLIIHSLDEKHVPDAQFTFEDHIEYRLTRQFPFSGVSGWHWDLYRRRD